MKKYLLLAIFWAWLGADCAHSQTVNDQPLPFVTLVPHYRIYVSYNTTTVLVFPVAVKPVDRGDGDILVQKQAGAENVLKVKANRKNFAPTNLHVFTADGNVYPFNVYYTDSLAETRNLALLGDTLFPLSGNVSSGIHLTGAVMNVAELDHLAAIVRNERPLLSVRCRHYAMTARLTVIASAGNLLFFRFTLANHSNLDYSVDFTRLYIADRQKVQRTSTQEHEIASIYQDTLQEIPAHQKVEFVLAIPRFTIPDHKQFHFELFEKQGGRQLSMEIRNKSLLRAQKL